ncbi:MAG: flagellar hook-length control protein FliK [Thiobacillus sp.]|nr:flagellar hook-length control protein FliK [Thiobacillus sp.]
MTTPPANLNPAASTQSQTAKGKSQDATSDSPFSQVLSTEMAQTRPSGRADSNDKTAPQQDATTDQTDSAALQTEMTDKPADGALAAAYDLLRADAQKHIPDPAAIPAITLGLTPALLRPAEADGADDALASAGDRQTGQAPRKAPLTRALQAAQTAQTEQAAARGATPGQEASAKTASAFAGQLAAAQQSDAAKNSDQLTGLIAHAALRPLTHGAVESTPVQSTHLSSQLTPSVGTTAWGQALGEKLVWMAAGAQQTASLTLNPPNLGPLQVVLNISNDQATASFFSAQPEVRQALEAAFPRLRDMMSEAGIQLGQASVSADTPQQQAFDAPAQRNLPAFGRTADSLAHDPSPAQLTPLRMGRGLVDTFA